MTERATRKIKQASEALQESRQEKTPKKAVKTKKRAKGISALAEEVAGILGTNAVHQGRDNVLGVPKQFIPSGVPDLDELLDREARGFPTGRIVEVFGASATCKTGFGYALIAQAQKLGGSAVIFPSEGNVDTWLLEQYGCNLDHLMIADSNRVEDVFKVCNLLIQKQKDAAPLVILIDSVAGLCTKEELDNPDFDRDRSAQVRALLISKALRKIGALIPSKNVILFLINQVRDGGMTLSGVKSKSKPPGGQAIGFYCSVRLRLEAGQKKWRQVKGKKFVSGMQLKITSEKNRLARPYQTTVIFLDFEEGLKAI